MTKQYDANAIEKLSFREGVRKRVNIYLDDSGHRGVVNGLLEIINNSTDEALVKPEANRIEIVIGKRNGNAYASVRDYGRGLPHGENKFSKEVMIDLLTDNHTGGKFNNGGYAGKSTRGQNGTGSGATCCSSSWFHVISYRDNAAWEMTFIDGIPQTDVCVKHESYGEKEGTFIEYEPSSKVFKSEEVYFDYDEICNLMEEYTYFNKGIVFEVKNSETGQVRTFLSKNGLSDFANTIIEKPIHSPFIKIEKEEDDVHIELILQWVDNPSQTYLFVNGGACPDGGTPLTGIKTSLTTYFKKKAKNVNPALFQRGLITICSVSLPDPSFGGGQTKGKLSDPRPRGLAQRICNEALKDYELRHKDELQKIIDFLTTEHKAEQAAERAREKVREHIAEMAQAKKTKILHPDKLRDARKLGQDSTLLICEGLSAGGSMSIGRDPNKYGILMLRGKVKNALAHPIEDVLSNEEITLFCQAMGMTYGQKYDVSKLRYGKVAIATDADVDGFHIGLLIMSMLEVLCPNFLKENRLYWLKAPLYKAEKGKNVKYFYTDEEFNKAKPSGNIVRFKGLGQMDDKDLKMSMFSEEFQKMELIKYSEKGKNLLLQLMGKDTTPKTNFVFNEIDFSNLTFE